MPTIVQRPDGRVQSYLDPHKEVCHLVAFTQEPNKLFCKSTAMWSYRPVFVDQSKITCRACREFLYTLD